MKDRTKNRIAALVLLLYSVATRFFSSIHSIRFDKNVMHGDGACFYVIGKAIMQGKVLYKDIFDHKTPYIYFINGLVSLLEYNHIGLFLVEVLILFVTLYFIFKILILFFENEKFKNDELLTEKQLYVISLIVTFIMGIVLSDFAITEGYYRTEAFAVALVMPAIYIMAKYYYGKINILNIPKQMFFIGLLAGLTFMINLKGIVLFVPLVIPLAFDFIKQKHWLGLLKTFCLGLFGVIIAILPYVIYMIVTDSVKDMIFAVWDTNLAYANDYINYKFESAAGVISTSGGLKNLLLLFFVKSPIATSFIILSIPILFLLKYNLKFKIGLCFEFLVALIITLSIGRPHIYYLYTLLPYIVVIFAFVIKLFINVVFNIGHINFKYSSVISIVLSFILLLAIIFGLNDKKICKVAEKSLKDAKELQDVAKQYDSNYSKLKILGFAYIPDIYLWLDADINYKYFVRPFITYNSFKVAFNEQTNYINNINPDIIVVRNFEFVPKQLEMQIKFILNYYYDLIGETNEYYLYGKIRK